MIVLDTNVVSELMNARPDPAVRGWLGAQPVAELFTTSITLAEILYGIERLPAGQRREGLHRMANGVFSAFATHVLPFDEAAAAHCASIVHARDRIGRPIDGFDAQIAAICRTRSATLASR